MLHRPVNDANAAGLPTTIADVRFSELIALDRRPTNAVAAHRTPIATDSYAYELNDSLRNNGFVSGLVDRRRGKRITASRRGFLRGALTAAAATTAATAANLFGPARQVEAQTGVVGTYPRRILQYCPAYNSGDNCQPGCGSSPICTDCCGSDGFFRNDPGNGYSLYAGGCGDGDIADGWLWRYSGTCGSCAEIEYRCSDGYVQTDSGPAPFICRAVTECVPLAEGQEAGPPLNDAARSTNWNPAGALEVAVDQGSAVSINGWIADGSGSPVQMRIRANNAIVYFGSAALARPDIQSSRRGAGLNVGFAVSIPMEAGDYQFCVDAVDGVVTSTIGCVNLTVGSGRSVRGNGVTGSIAPPPPANSNNTNDANADNSNETPNDTPETTPTPGEIVLPDEKETTGAPLYGAVQVLRRTGTTSGFVSGWAGDSDSTDPAFVDVAVNGESVLVARTELPRPDVAAAFDLSATTGFALDFELPAEAVDVCITAISPDGERRSLGCQILGPAASENAAESDPADNPPAATGSAAADADIVYGAIDATTYDNGVLTVTGWAFDPNEHDRAIAINVEAAGAATSTETGKPHPAARQRYGVQGAGFSVELALDPGTYDLTVTALSAGAQPVVLGEQPLELS